MYYTKDDAIYSCDLDSFNVNEYIKFNYYPRCFDHVDDYIVTGGLLTTSSKMFSLNLQNLTYDSQMLLLILVAVPITIIITLLIACHQLLSEEFPRVVFIL